MDVGRRRAGQGRAEQTAEQSFKKPRVHLPNLSSRWLVEWCATRKCAKCNMQRISGTNPVVEAASTVCQLFASVDGVTTGDVGEEERTVWPMERE